MSYNKEVPFIIDFNKIGLPATGYISVFEGNDKLPFNVERVFWTYFTPEDVVRGKHAHYKTEQILIAIAGKIEVTIIMPDEEKLKFTLDKPHLGLFVPPHCWHTMQYSHSSVQLVFASEKYSEKDYIRSYDKFKEVYRK